MLKIIREILALLWKVLRLYLRKWIRRILGKFALIVFALAVMAIFIGLILSRC